MEELILVAAREAASPLLRFRPRSKWLLMTGSSRDGKQKIDNTGIFVMRTDGSLLTQLTYHPGWRPLRPVRASWDPDGKSICFLSRRGSTDRSYNVWKMEFARRTLLLLIQQSPTVCALLTLTASA
ncbi:MAG: hypothetical protein LUC33_05845 [Prevotellaceae bacterium]|nr:hypothetical protein [Prevotellaceae bacterium]